MSRGTLDGDLHLLNLKARAYHALARFGSRSIEQLQQLNDEKLLKIPQLGLGALDEIRTAQLADNFIAFGIIDPILDSDLHKAPADRDFRLSHLNLLDTN